MNKRIIVAKTAGFCFGVDRAINMVNSMIDEKNKVSTLGPIIHNTQVVNELKDKGVRSIDDIDEAKIDEKVVIRSHGVGPDIYNRLKEKNILYEDATCPYVSKIHKIVSKKSSSGNIVLIAGDKNHPEVIAIKGHCLAQSYVFKDCDELLELHKQHPEFSEKSLIIVAQTTFNKNLWRKCSEIAEKLYTNALIFDTICSATHSRQEEAEALSKKVDIMLVIGGRHSSNTIKLYELCRQNCSTYHIETAGELKDIDFSDVGSIGITAGASTPAYLIKEVQNTMTDILVKKDEEFNFEEALEQTFKKIYTGNRVRGIITSVNKSEAIVDIGVKQTGYIPHSEISDDPSVSPTDVLKPGDELDLIVIKVNDQEGVVTLSKKKVDSMIGFEKVMEAHKEDAILEGVVTNVVKGGILVSVSGMKVFIPASQATMNRNDNLNDLLKTTVSFKILEVNEQRSRAVGSIRAVEREKRKAEQAKFWEEIEIGEKFTGEVKSITSYGAFVNLGVIDGMVHISELSWSRIKHPSEVVKVGDILDVYVKDLDKERKRISLGFKKAEDNPWEIFKNEYKTGDIIKGKVVSIMPFGAFVQIIPGIDGLIHVSQIDTQRITNVADVLSVGQEVEALLTDIDLENKRISLSMRALIEEKDADSEADAIEEAAAIAGVTITSDEEDAQQDDDEE